MANADLWQAPSYEELLKIKSIMRDSILKFVVAGMFAAAFIGGCAIYDGHESHISKGLEIHIAHINDTHSAFDPIHSEFETVFDSGPLSVNTEVGGHPRLLTAFELIQDEMEARQEPLLFFHGGDAFQGSAYFLLNEGQMNADILSRFSLDAMVLGNHEFDLDNRRLNAFIENVNFPVLGTNVDATQDADLGQQDNLVPVVFFHIQNGEKQRLSKGALQHLDSAALSNVVAVIGMVIDTMPNISPETGSVIFHPMIESAQLAVDKIESSGVQHIIAVTHIGLEEDIRLAENVNGIDVIVGGHSHTLLGDFSHVGWGVEPEYAQRRLNPNGETETCIVQAGQYAQAIGLVSVQFDASGQVKNCNGGNSLLIGERYFSNSEHRIENEFAASVSQQIRNFFDEQEGISVTQPNVNLSTLIGSEYRPELEQAYGDVIGFVPQNLRHVRLPGSYGIDQHGSDLAPLIAYAQYHFFTHEHVIAQTGKTPDFALLGAGGIRKPLLQGEVREGHMGLEILPFGSHLALLELTGAQVKALLLETISATLPDGAHAGKFPYGGNLRYYFEETEAGTAGRLNYVEVNRGSLEEPEWEALQDEETYQVVMNSYSADGNDGWNTVFEAQVGSSKRIDIAIVDGLPEGFAVERMMQTEQGGYRAVYENDAPNCDNASVVCAVDALSVINFLRLERPNVLEIPYPVVTLERLEQ